MSVIPVFESVRESLAKIYRLTSLLSVASNFSERLVNNRLVRCDHFFDFQYGFRSSRATIALLGVMSNGIANTSGFPRTVARHIFRLLTGFGTLVVFIISSPLKFQVGL